MTNRLKISKRLCVAAELCRRGSRIADVGTDHAYLPIYLLQSGIAASGVVTDINKGPIDRARANILEYGMEKRLSAVLCDGLSKVEPHCADDIFILGMGGELIAKIISEAPWTKDPRVRLILQPMTHPELLRKYLSDNGYETVSETVVKDDKLYQIMAVEYSGKNIQYNELELMFGRLNLQEGSPLLYELLDRTCEVMKERIKGKMIAGADTSYEEKIIKMIGEIK